MLTRELHNKALVAAETATTDYINKYGEHDACGFAWVTAYVNGASKPVSYTHLTLPTILLV